MASLVSDGYGSDASDADEAAVVADRETDAAPTAAVDAQARAVVRSASEGAAQAVSERSSVHARVVERLPGAAELLGDAFPNASQSTSLSTALKRTPPPSGNGSAAAANKQPRRLLQTAAASGARSDLVPPQLRGRSNVSTEDLDRLFVRRRQQQQSG
eukprot:jgi/Chlat1/4119/Chrsp269S03955